jgi:glucosamine-6-phosphate deaminase
MRIIIKDSYEEMSKAAASVVKSQLLLHPDCVLGCATGGTPLGLYRELVKAYKNEELDFSEASFFNLDEYCGLSPASDQSYSYYMRENFFDHINAKSDRIHIPNGMAEDADSECHRYDADIALHGGIDLQILGIGVNGHIGFNEPNAHFCPNTHKVILDETTIESNARYFQSMEEVPTEAITMGVRPILQSKILLLLANGENKAEAVAAALRGPICPELPASILQLHPNVIAVLDRGAAGRL